MRNLLLTIAASALFMGSANSATVITHSAGKAAVAPKDATANPIIFATAFPAGGFASNTATFANQKTDMQSGGRGGDLYIRYPDGTLRNLTKEAGYGSTDPTGFQDANAIAVRDPSVYWDGTRAIFSMVIGAPARQYQQITVYWQLYEVTGLQEGGHATITKVADQPANFNNIYPTYGSNGAIFFVSDMPRGGEAQRYLYPQLDEYESTPTNTGIWKLQNGVVTQMVDAPSGDFHPQVDWYGRVVFTEWDHMQRDQQCDTAAAAQSHGCFDYASEAQNAATTTNLVEVYPELRIGADQSKINNHTFNLFFPWAVNQDGTTAETIDHVGRHELQGYFNRSFTNDPAIIDFTAPNTPTRLNECHQVTVVPTELGHYLCIDAPEFETQASGAIVQLALPLGAHADQQPPPQFLTAKVNNQPYSGTPPAGFTGHYRDPIKLTTGPYVASWDPTPGNYSLGDRANPAPNYKFRLSQLVVGSDGYLKNGPLLTNGIVKTIKYYDPDVLVTYTGPLWELQAAEIVARPEPPLTTTALEPPELASFSAAGVDPAQFKAWLVQHDLAVFVSRNVTSRDDADKQQPYNLQVPGGVRTVNGTGKVYDISTLQFFEGSAVRGNVGRSGRRKLARNMTDPEAVSANPPAPNGTPSGTVSIFPDGSIAAFVPANKAMTWQTVSPALEPVVRERYWLTAQKGEIRACDSCHGTNTLNQGGQPPPQNTPAAFTNLLTYWRAHNGGTEPPANTPPVADFSFVVNDLSVSFTDLSTDSDGTISSRAWAFGDNATSTATNPAHAYATAGTYHVTLTVKDNDQAPASKTRDVTVTAAPPPECTNPHPDETPICADGQHQTGGTWVQAAPPVCTWAYQNGACPPPVPAFNATIVQGRVKCPQPFDPLAGFTVFIVPKVGATHTAAPNVITGYAAKIVQGTTICTLPNSNQLKVTFGAKP